MPHKWTKYYSLSTTDDWIKLYLPTLYEKGLI